MKTTQVASWSHILSKSRSQFNLLYCRLDAKEAPTLSDSTLVEFDDPLRAPIVAPEKQIKHAISEDTELMDTISKDVDRTFPDSSFFRQDSSQKSLTKILLTYAISNPDVGYRQGMHELAGAMLFVITNDYSKELVEDSDIFDPEYIEADAFSLFSDLMDTLSPFYQVESKKTLPIIVKSNHIVNDLLAQADPDLFDALAKTTIEPQIWGIRWIRMLFGREFSFWEMLSLWDGLFSASIGETGLNDLIDYVCLVMLIKVRDRIIGKDETEILTVLLNYSSVDDEEETIAINADDEYTPEDIVLYVKNALYLKQNLSPIGGQYVYEQFMKNFSRPSRASYSESDEDDVSEVELQPTSSSLSFSKSAILDSLYSKAKAILSDQLQIDKTTLQNWDVEKVVRALTSTSSTNQRKKDNYLANMIRDATFLMTTEDSAVMEKLKHVEECLRNPSKSYIFSGRSDTEKIQNDSSEQPPATPSYRTAPPSTSSNSLPTMAVPKLPESTPLNSPSILNRSPDNHSSADNDKDLLFKSPERIKLVQSEFSWMVSDTSPSTTTSTSKSKSSGPRRKKHSLIPLSYRNPESSSDQSLL